MTQAEIEAYWASGMPAVYQELARHIPRSIVLRVYKEIEAEVAYQ